jgi:hypothetical protein
MLCNDASGGAARPRQPRPSNQNLIRAAQLPYSRRFGSVFNGTQVPSYRPTRIGAWKFYDGFL